MEQNISNEILFYTQQLKLPQVRKNCISQAELSASENQSFEQYLLKLLELEYTQRKENRRKASIRYANFPQNKYLLDLKREELPEEALKILPQLERLDFIKSGQNIIFSGNPGTGKTHIAIGLGIKACLEGYKVLFTTVPRLLTQIRESRSQKTFRTMELKFEKYDLVICDEFGYVSFDKEGTDLIFNYLSLRAGRKSTIVTTNLPFDRWTEIFGDPIITAAMVDRLAHKAYLVNMTGKSYRVKETKLWLKK
jgi:DNA replication protein DnaC